MTDHIQVILQQGTCILTYRFSSEEHFGEIPTESSLPFDSVEIEVCFLQ
jgi:hypothetical protein